MRIGEEVPNFGGSLHRPDYPGRMIMNSYRSVAARIVKRIQALAASRGLLVMRYSESNYLTPHLTKAINTFQIDTVIDVGANLGQTVDELRASGFDGKIVSFEPTPGLFRALVAKHGSDPGWTGHQLALGSRAKCFCVVIVQRTSIHS